MSTEAWIGISSLALTALMGVGGLVASVVISLIGYLMKRAIDGVDEKVAVQGARQDRFCERLGKIENNMASMATAGATVADEVRRLRDANHDQRNAENIRNLRNEVSSGSRE